MHRTAQDFEKQAKVKAISKWIIHHCSFCNYPCGYLFMNDTVQYDNGCRCLKNYPKPRNWQDVADHYNRQTHPQVIEQMNQFWGFEVSESGAGTGVESTA